MTRCMLVISLLFPVVAALKTQSSSLPAHQSPGHDRSSKAEASKQPALKLSNTRGLSADLAMLEEQRLTANVSQILQVPTVPCCIIIMCFQFMIVYTALALCRTYHVLSNTATGQLEAAIRAAAQTLTYGPMLCVLFAACQMRVDSLSNGKGEPQAWVQKCMSGLTFGVWMSTLLVLVIQSIAGKPIRLKDNPFDVEQPFEEIQKGYKAAFYALTIVRYLFLITLCSGLAAVIYGICTYLPPTSKKLGDVTAPAPAVMCTMILAVGFFSAQVIVAVCRTFSEHTRLHFPQVVGMMHATATSMEFAPVLAVLFLTAHMRAAQHDTEPDDWVHSCMVISTGALCVATLLATMVPLVLCGTLKKNPWTNELVVEVPKPTLGYIFIGLRYVFLLCFYGSAAGVMLSILIFESPGPKPTMPISPVVQCVVNLTCQFFFVYFLATVLLTASELTGGTVPMEKWSLYSAIEAARSTLAFAPMLSTMFLATSMPGSPAAWVQDAMYLATWSLQATGAMCLISGLFMAKTKTDYDGNIVNQFSNRYIGITVVAVRYLAMLLMYSGMVMVIVDLVTSRHRSQ